MLRVVAPALAALMRSGIKSFAEVEALTEADIFDPKALEKLAPAIEALAGAVDPEALPALFCELLCNTTIDVPGTDGRPNRISLGNQVAFDLAFGGDRDRLIFRVLAFAAGVNFGDFFGARGSESASPPTPTA
jgi:hypothetical protein